MFNRGFLCFIFMLLTFPAQAAPFCLAGVGMPPQCIYDDIKVCVEAINSRDLHCTANPEAVLSYSGGSRYCRVTSYLSAECIFNDRLQCRREASMRGDICIDRTAMGDDTNPYRYDERIQN